MAKDLNLALGHAQTVMRQATYAFLWGSRIPGQVGYCDVQEPSVAL